MPEVCGTCKAPIAWAITPKGKGAPIDREPDAEKGNTLVLRVEGFGRPLAIVLSGDALTTARTRGLNLRTNHWATCPDREQWRETTDAKAAADG